MQSLKKFGFIITVATLSILFIGRALSQTAEDPTVPTPEVSFTVLAGDEGAAPDPGTTGATIIASIPEDKQCECGARIEAKESTKTDWVVLGLYAPMETGDEYQQYQWSYTGNFFEQDKSYDVRVLIYDRLGIQSEYGTNQFAMTPYHENACADGSFTNLKKSTSGTGENAVMFFSWDKVCSQTKEANRYVLYKNGSLVEESDQGANNIAVLGAPDGSTWKIEASGDEPPNTNPSVIKTCDEVKSKINAKTYGTTYSTSAQVTDLVECQVVGHWLRTIIAWSPWVNNGYSNQDLPPSGWMSYSLGIGGTPYFNYPPLHSNARPNFPGQGFWDAYDQCGNNNQNWSGGSYTDPWGQVGWSCNSDYNYSNNSSLFRFWVNFDLNASGAGSVWPVTTEFSY